MKNFLNNILVWIVSRLIYLLIRSFNLTYRYRFSGLENIKSAKEISKTGSFLLGIWHQTLLQGILAQIGKSYVVIISKSEDANPVAYTCARLGHVVVRGSSKSKKGVDKGGKEGKKEMIKVLKTGLPGSVTVDGPKGPAKEVKPGIIDMAIKSGAVLIPYAPIAETYWEFNSWDKFRFPKPFSRIIVRYGDPINVLIDEAGKDFIYYQTLLKQGLDAGEVVAVNKFSNWDRLSKINKI